MRILHSFVITIKFQRLSNFSSSLSIQSWTRRNKFFSKARVRTHMTSPIRFYYELSSQNCLHTLKISLWWCQALFLTVLILSIKKGEKNFWNWTRGSNLKNFFNLTLLRIPRRDMLRKHSMDHGYSLLSRWVYRQKRKENFLLYELD